MAENLGTIWARLRLNNTDFNTSIARSQRKLVGFSKYTGLIGTALATGLVFKTSKAFLQFDDQMTKSLAIMGNVSTAARDSLGRTAKALSREYLFSASELAKGYFFLFSAGKSLTQSQKLLGTVAEFAQAGQFDLALATTLLSDAQKALGLSFKDAAKDGMSMKRVADVLVKANTMANASVEQFATALTSEAAAAMKAFGIELEEGVAVLAAYADLGIKAQVAGSSFARVLRLLIPAATKNAKEFEKLNINVFDTEGNLRKMHSIIRDMETAFATMSVRQKSAALSALGFQKRIQGAILPLLGASENIKQFEENTKNATGKSMDVANKQLNSFISQWKILKSNISENIIELTRMVKVYGAIKSAMEAINTQNKKAEKLILAPAKPGDTLPVPKRKPLSYYSFRPDRYIRDLLLPDIGPTTLAPDPQATLNIQRSRRRRDQAFVGSLSTPENQVKALQIQNQIDHNTGESTKLLKQQVKTQEETNRLIDNLRIQMIYEGAL